MQKITLKLQNLRDGETSYQEFEDEAATLAYLRARPRFVDVLGVVFEGLTPEQNARLKVAKRPLDEDERAAEQKVAEAAAKAAEAAQEQRERDALKAHEAHREAMKNADPNRTMEVRYLYDKGLALTDPSDGRAITDEAREAVLAWVAERNEWVESRGQIVGEAKVTVWPGTLPKKGADRVQGGTFIPCTAPPKPTA